MNLLRAWSIASSSVTLTLSLAIFAFASHSEWQEFKKTQKLQWKKFLDLAVHCATTFGFSVSLLVCSIKWIERWNVIVLLLFGRYLLIRQAQFLWKFLRGIQFGRENDSGSMSISIADKLLRCIPWAILALSGCFLGSTVFIVQEIARAQRPEVALRLGLILFAGELLGLSGVYAYLILRFRKRGKSLLTHYSLALAFMTSLLGCLSAFLLFFLQPLHRINWVLAMWIHFATVALWLVRSFILGLQEFLEYRRGKGRTSDDSAEPSRARIQGFYELDGGSTPFPIAT